MTYLYLEVGVGSIESTLHLLIQLHSLLLGGPPLVPGERGGREGGRRREEGKGESEGGVRVRDE